MAEVIGRDGTWAFDGETVRIVPGHGRGVHQLRQALGEVTIPLAALAGMSFEAGKKGGRLRLRLRDGADPFSQAARGQLGDTADPYQLAVDTDRTGAAEYLVDEVRNALVIEQVPDGPSDRWLLPGPRVPLTAAAGDGSAAFDGERVRLEWNGMARDSKRKMGAREFALKELAAVDWAPIVSLENGYLRFRLKAGDTGLPPKQDPNALTWGMKREGGTTVLVAAAVICRLPHPSAPLDALPPAEEPAPSDDPDALLRRLRELGELHREGVLTDEEFTTAKQALLRRL